ncbi:unnamed protein product [Rhodiola kirilowii]
MATAVDFSALQLIKNHLFDELASPLVKQDPNQIFEFAAEFDGFFTPGGSSDIAFDWQNPNQIFEFKAPTELVKLVTPKPPISTRKPALNISLPSKTEWIEFAEKPQQISNLAQEFPQLRTLRSCDLLCSSWISVAWYYYYFPLYLCPICGL